MSTFRYAYKQIIIDIVNESSESIFDFSLIIAVLHRNIMGIVIVKKLFWL